VAGQVQSVGQPSGVILAPPAATVGVVGWLRQNLFPSPLNAALTLLVLYVLYLAIPPVVRWALIDADWVGSTREACSRDGACWVFIRVWFERLMYGLYPREEIWRINVGYGVLAVAGVLLFVPRFPWKHWIGVFLLLVYPVIAFFLFVGGTFAVSLVHLAVGLALIGSTVVRLTPAFRGRAWSAPWGRVYPAFALGALAWLVLGGWLLDLAPLTVSVHLWPQVETRLWGGLFLTLVIAAVGIVGSLPLGILLALGRRSHMPLIRAICVAFIEVWRGVPLITVLFMASNMFPLFMPEGVNFDKLLRALLGVTIFASAYMAEVVRGGLQAIPRGQYEAAEALGLGYWRTTGLVILPQALKIVIPGIVNSFIGLFKDSTLVLVIGLFDFLGMAQAAASNAHWMGFAIEGYVFTGLGFWIFCFGMSRYSQRLERRLHTVR
jgi:general L-amino acid transport system permease protein